MFAHGKSFDLKEAKRRLAKTRPRRSLAFSRPVDHEVVRVGGAYVIELKFAVWLWLASLTMSSNLARAADVTVGAVKSPHRACDLVLIGDIEPGDDAKFARELSRLLESECKSPTVHLYSRGGNVDAAIGIAEQVYALRLRTVAPTLVFKPGDLQYSPDGARYCPMLPGAIARRELEGNAYHQEFERALQNHTPTPDRILHGEFDPKAGIGDPNCSCASACFYIWAAGAERDGDVVQVHRPYFNSEEYSTLSANEAQAAYKALQEKVRDFLTKVESALRSLTR